MEVRFVTPPDLDEKNIYKKIICYRPLRKEAPRISTQVIGNKILADNYGHGGSGWTLGPGSAAHVCNQIMNQVQKLKIDSITTVPVTVVGAGAIGLLTTLELVQKGFRNVQVIAEEFDNLASRNAGGLFAASGMANKKQFSKEVSDLLSDFSLIGFQVYGLIAQNRHPILKQGARYLQLYIEEMYDPMGQYVEMGIVEKPKPIILDFGNGFQRQLLTHNKALYMDTPALMKELSRVLKQDFKVEFIRKRIKNFEEVESQIVVNCTGLGAKTLCNDNLMTPVQGHIIMLANQKPEKLQYLVAVERGTVTNKRGLINPAAFYQMPKKWPGSEDSQLGVIGGSFVEGADCDNEEQFDYILDRAREFYGVKQQLRSKL